MKDKDDMYQNTYNDNLLEMFHNLATNRLLLID